MTASGHCELMEDAHLLAVAYRGRPATIHELATLSHTSIEAARTAVKRLRGRGQLGGRGERIAYSSPVNWAAEMIAARAAQLQESTRDLLAKIEQVVADLPEMSAHWSVGETSSDPVPIVTRHGPRAAEDLWYEVGRHHTGSLQAVLPDVSRFLTSSPERVARATQIMRGKDAVLLILPTAASELPGIGELLIAFSAAGIEYRFLDDPPSWLWVDGDQLAVPFEWGEARPTSVMSVRNAALAGMLSAYFETLWRAAAPPAPAADSWTPLLTLMRKGITLETASRMIGVNPRTGRRRVAHAMAHYDVSTLFALGVAWSADAEARR